MPTTRKHRIRVNGAVEKATDWTVEGLLKEMAADAKEIRYTSKKQEMKARRDPFAQAGNRGQAQARPQAEEPPAGIHRDGAGAPTVTQRASALAS